MNRVAVPDAASLQKLPASLLRLSINTGGYIPGASPVVINLSHLTRVTQLSANISIAPGSRLPPSIQTLTAWDRGCTVEAIAAHPLVQLQFLSLLGFNPVAGQLRCLSSLTTLTSFKTDHYNTGNIATSAAHWKHLPRLQDVKCSIGCSNRASAGPLLRDPQHQFLVHLSSATSLTRLTFDFDDARSPEPADLESFFAHLAPLTCLQRLSLKQAKFGSAALPLMRLTSLQVLKLYFAGISDMVAVGIGCNMKQLVRLQLRGNADLTDACTPALAQLTNLVNLDLSHVDKITDAGVLQLTTLVQLENLETDETNISNEALQTFWDAINDQ